MSHPDPLTPARRDELIAAMRGRIIAVVGDVMLDRYLEGDVERISPEAPVPVVRVQAHRSAPGGAANVAANLAAVGAVPRLVGLAGPDAEGETLRRRLEDNGISDRHLIADPDRQTTVKTRVLARGQQVVRVDEESDAPATADVARRLEVEALAALEDAHALVFEDYDKGALAPPLIQTLVAAARRRHLPIVADPKHRNFLAYGGVTVFKPNRRELTAATGWEVDPADQAALVALTSRLEVEHLLVTLGAAGMVLCTATGPCEVIPAHERTVFDVSGAGDTVAAWVAAALAAGATVPEAARLANRAAAVEVGKTGVSTVLPEETRALP